jgi:hypothetical protein
VKSLTTSTFLEKIGFKDKKKEETLWEQGAKFAKINQNKIT